MATTWFNKVAIPLKFLILLPIILTQLDALTISTYYLLSSGAILMSFCNANLIYVFTTMLTYAYGGASDLSAISSTKKLSETRGEEKPNWEVFQQCLSTLKKLQYYLAIPSSILGSLIVFYGIMGLIDWDWARWELWSLSLLVNAGLIVNLITSRYISACHAIGQIAFINRESLKFIVLNILLCALIVWITQSLFVMICTQVCIDLIQKVHVIRVTKKVLDRHNINLKAPTAFDHAIYKASLKPLVKSSLAILSSTGLRAYLAIYVASKKEVFGEDVVASYLLSQNIIQTIISFSVVPVSSSIPFLAKYLIQGDHARLAKRANEKITQSLVLLFAALLGLNLAGGVLLNKIGSNVELLPIQILAVMSLLVFAREGQNFYVTVYNITNEMKFFLRSILSCAFVILLLVFIKMETVMSFVVYTNIGFILFMGVYPIREYLKLIHGRKPMASIS